MSKRFNYLLLAIFVFAFGLRVVGIDHGFPFIFHPDEPAVVRAALALRFDKNPGHFDWPHLYLYINYFLFMVFAKIRTFLLSGSLQSYVPQIVRNDELIFYLLSRAFSAFLGALTVVPVYLAAKSFFNKRVALFSALVFAVLPFSVWQSHYALIDVPTAFWIAWSLYFSSKILHSDELKNYLLAGLFVGFAASTKYHGGFASLAVLLAHVFRIFRTPNKNLADKSFFSLVVSGFFAVLGFFVGTPFSVIDFETFISTDSPKGALWQFANVGSVGFVQNLVTFFSIFFTKFTSDWGYTFVALYVFGFFYLLYKTIKSKEEGKKLEIWLLYAVSLFMIFYISGFEKNRSHYYMICYPFVAVLVGLFIDSLTSRGKKFVTKTLISLLLFSVPTFFSVRNAYLFAKEDTQSIFYTGFLESLDPEYLLVYDGEDLMKIVKSKHIENPSTKSKELQEIDFYSISGYLIVEVSDTLEVATKGNPLSLVTKPLMLISNENRRGPEIAIYSLPFDEIN